MKSFRCKAHRCRQDIVGQPPEPSAVVHCGCGSLTVDGNGNANSTFGHEDITPARDDRFTEPREDLASDDRFRGGR